MDGESLSVTGSKNLLSLLFLFLIFFVTSHSYKR